MSNNTPSENTPLYHIDTLELGPMENFIYLIQDLKSKRAAVVDPAWDVEAIHQLASKKGVHITDILLTHSHHDHINGITGILDKHDAQLHLLKSEAQFWGQEIHTPSLHHGGDVFQLGETAIEILHTPGHTPGSACYKINNDLITGDTLFVFGCGRCDLAGGDPEQMYHTLKKMGDELPSTTKILPGHNYATQETCSMYEQIEGNPFMHFENSNDFVHYRMHKHDRIRHSPYQAISK
ncbi:MBL fold metallo-hydrolase [Beggiatoa alba]|nr:MBL fold metallo-hydrolase [Beggiatoa alba]